MRKIIITTVLIVLLALMGTSAAPRSSGVDACAHDPQSCMNRELAWPDFLDNSVKSVRGVLA